MQEASLSAGSPACVGDGLMADYDEELVAAAQADPEALGPLYERYLERVYRYCYFRLGSRQPAEDATSEVFLRVLANLHRYRRGVFAAWLYTIARNVVNNHHRDRQRLGSLEQDAHAASLAVAEDEELDTLLAALATLPAEQRTVLELQLAGFSGEQIAAALGKSVAAVKMARYRAVGRLRRLLG